ncbi:MAG: 4-hydroxy-tetrahydrodipicolinate synthase [Bacteroidota bacterium]
MDNSKFKGTGVALVTPFSDNGGVDYSSLGEIVQHVSKGGVNYLVVLGTTAETPALSSEEKLKIIDKVKKVNSGKLPIIAGFGGNNTQELISGIKTADFEGIDALLSVAPWYNKPTQEGIYQHFSRVAETSPVPVILYNVPGRTSSNISSETCLRLAHNYPDKIIGIKEASGDLKQIMEILSDKPSSFHVISGDDAITPVMIALGGSGVISVIANAYPSEFSQMVNLALDNKPQEARKHHFPLLPIIDAMFAEGNPAGVKAFMKHRGLLRDNVRLPLVKVSKALDDKIKVLNESMK